MPAPAAPPVDFEALRELDTIALKEMGCGAWDAPDADGKALMLFPAEWYSSIPNGTEVVSIIGRRIFFIRGHTSRDADNRDNGNQGNNRLLAFGSKVSDRDHQFEFHICF